MDSIENLDNIDVSNNKQTTDIRNKLHVGGVAWDIAQKNHPTVYITGKISDTIKQYDNNINTGKPLTEYPANQIVQPTPQDTVYQIVYIQKTPCNNNGWNQPHTKYPVPESRLFPFQHNEAKPIGDSPNLTPTTTNNNQPTQKTTKMLKEIGNALKQYNNTTSTPETNHNQEAFKTALRNVFNKTVEKHIMKEITPETGDNK